MTPDPELREHIARVLADWIESYSVDFWPDCERGADAILSDPLVAARLGEYEQVDGEWWKWRWSSVNGNSWRFTVTEVSDKQPTTAVFVRRQGTPEPEHRSIGKVYEPNGWGDCEVCGRPWPCPQARINYMGSVGITPPHAMNSAALPEGTPPTEPGRGEWRIVDDEGTICTVEYDDLDAAYADAEMLDRENPPARHYVEGAVVTWVREPARFPAAPPVEAEDQG